MLKFRNEIIENYYADPRTSLIIDSRGNTIEPHLHRGYYYVMLNGKGYALHNIIGHTFLGYFKNCIIHHEDENPQNNVIGNLKLMTRKDHISLHKKGCHYSDEIKKGMAAAHVGQESPMKGNHHSEETKKLISKKKTGVPLSNEHKKAISEGIKGENNPAFGRKWWTNGIDQIFCKDCPGSDYVNMTLKKYLKLREQEKETA